MNKCILDMFFFYGARVNPEIVNLPPCAQNDLRGQMITVLEKRNTYFLMLTSVP